MADSSEKYKQFDFSGNQQWLRYLNELFPTPPYNKIELFKRKWYQKNIDQSFDINFDNFQQQQQQQQQQPSTDTKQQSSTSEQQQQNSQSTTQQQEQQQKAQDNNQQQQSQQNQNQQQQQQQAHGDQSQNLSFLYKLEGNLKIFFFLSILVARNATNSICMIICALAILRQCKRPQFSKEYLIKVTRNEFCQNIMFLVAVSLIKQQSFIFLLPLMVHFWLGICDYVILSKASGFIARKIYSIQKVGHVIDTSRQYRGVLMYNKAKFEVQMLFLLIVMTIFGVTSFMAIIIYSFFIKNKYALSQNTQSAFSEINWWIEGKMNSRYCPGLVKNLVNLIRKAFSYFKPQM